MLFLMIDYNDMNLPNIFNPDSISHNVIGVSKHIIKNKVIHTVMNTLNIQIKILVSFNITVVLLYLFIKVYHDTIGYLYLFQMFFFSNY